MVRSQSKHQSAHFFAAVVRSQLILAILGVSSDAENPVHGIIHIFRFSDGDLRKIPKSPTGQLNAQRRALEDFLTPLGDTGKDTLKNST